MIKALFAILKHYAAKLFIGLLIPYVLSAHYGLEDPYILLAIFIFSYLASSLILPKLHLRKSCAWCGSRKLSYQEGREGMAIWKYRNADGSRDKRVKDNSSTANFLSKWLCKDCDAVTKFVHSPHRRPSKRRSIIIRSLDSEGNTDRTGTDWESMFNYTYEGAKRKGRA
ncbi:hypothetical protein AB9K35_04330 [Leisingera sp. XS_AS12]|uniref:hypothetical protein n=1 Tax=Leisingera sp. XS_AS12 TaxID=3241294 RepID=UPI003513DC7F